MVLYSDPPLGSGAVDQDIHSGIACTAKRDRIDIPLARSAPRIAAFELVPSIATRDSGRSSPAPNVAQMRDVQQYQSK